MNYSRILVLSLFIFFGSINLVTAQNANELSGVVFELSDGKKVPLPGANIYWAGSTIGTTSDSKGKFVIERPSKGKANLVFSYVGYNTDTIPVSPTQKNISMTMSASLLLKEVVVEERVFGEEISKTKTISTQTISEKGLQKLPCCNLSESFENSAAVDVSYTDAVSGAKQIEMLGLAGVYSQMMSENIPSLRGMAASYGLGYIPGTWLESIQISKGASAVINGYESTTGQINVEFKKPDKSDLFFLNAYGNHMGKVEGNITSAHKINDRWSTMLFVHGEDFRNKVDMNGDSFLDMPLMNQINVFNRWKYFGPKIKSQFGFKYLTEERSGGQMDFFNDEALTPAYGIGIKTNRAEFFGKFGFPFERHATSIGMVASATYHNQDGFFGANLYNGTQNSLYYNLIYQTYLVSTTNVINAGVSFNYDQFDEIFNDTTFAREEIVPGAFLQYTYSNPEHLSAIAGIRYDYNSKFGHIITPRFHIKYNFDLNTVIRGSAGKGYRSANVLSENAGVLASSRKLVFVEELEMERAWNYGLGFSKLFNLNDGKIVDFSIDFYRTDFQNQAVVDMDSYTGKVLFYNLDGKSYSNSGQVDLKLELIKRLELNFAFRINDVKTTLNSELVEKPLVSKYKGLFNASYSTNFDKWAFDFTAQYNGVSRLPNTSTNPVQYQKAEFSDDFFILHAQVTKRFKKLDVYAGAENLTNFVQKDPIIAADDPFGSYFDSSMIWGPIFGRMFYAGLRFKIQ